MCGVKKMSKLVLRFATEVCQRWVLVLYLDAIFFPHEPIMMAVEPHSMAWVAGRAALRG